MIMCTVLGCGVCYALYVLGCGVCCGECVLLLLSAVCCLL